MKKSKIYLDTNIYFRPFDDQTISRIFLEMNAIMIILKAIEEQTFSLITSDILFFEIAQSNKQFAKIDQMLNLAKVHIQHTEKDLKQAKSLQKKI